MHFPSVSMRTLVHRPAILARSDYDETFKDALIGAGDRLAAVCRNVVGAGSIHAATAANTTATSNPTVDAAASAAARSVGNATASAAGIDRSAANGDTGDPATAADRRPAADAAASSPAATTGADHYANHHRTGCACPGEFVHAACRGRAGAEFRAAVQRRQIDLRVPGIGLSTAGQRFQIRRPQS